MDRDGYRELDAICTLNYLTWEKLMLTIDGTMYARDLFQVFRLYVHVENRNEPKKRSICKCPIVT